MEHSQLFNGSGSDSRSDGVPPQSVEESSSNVKSSSLPSTGLGAPSTAGAVTPSPSAPSSNVPAAGVSTKAEQAPSKERLGLKDREDRVRVLRDRQQAERLQKLEELKEHALSAQKFREQQEQLRRHRLEELRARDVDRRSQVEERKRVIQQAEHERRDAVVKKAQEREQRLEHKRRQERSNVVFGFGSSTPRMLDPKENKAYWAQRRATSTSNVNMSDSTVGLHRSSDNGRGDFMNGDLSRKRATSAHSLNRKGDGEDLMTQSVNMSALPSAARRRTDLLPTVPSHNVGRAAGGGSPRHKSPGRAVSMGRLDSQARLTPMAPLHENPNPIPIPASKSQSRSAQRMKSAAKNALSKSMSNLGPQKRARNIGAHTDGVGVPIAEGSLDRGSSRSSLALAPHPPPRMTRGEILRRNKLKADAAAIKASASTSSKDTSTANKSLRSGNTTPVSTSRPNSALSQVSSGQVMMRTRTTPRKPRPLSIAGSAPSKSEHSRRPLSIAALGSNPPSGATTPNRESRSIERKLSSVGAAAPTIPSKSNRAKSVGSDNSAPVTPSKSSKPSVPKRTPAQVKAESAAKKAAAGVKAKSTPKSPSDKSSAAEKKTSATAGAASKVVADATKSEPETIEKEKSSISPVEEMDSIVSEVTTSEISQVEVKSDIKIEDLESSSTTTESVITIAMEESSNKEVTIVVTQEDTEIVPVSQTDVVLPRGVADVVEAVKKNSEETSEEVPSDVKPSEDTTTPKTPKPVTGYATEEDYKAVLAEKRRQAREQKEKEQEMERQREIAEEERIRKEEEDYLLLMEDQKKVEEERLEKAIEEANKQREEDAKRKEEEEIQRIEAERIENEKRIEAEEKLKREEEERQLRKSRVAAIMARTRGASKSKSDVKTPDEVKSIGDSLMATSVNDALLANMTNSMTDSMIVQVIQTHQGDKEHENEESKSIEDNQPQSDISSQPTSGVVSDAPSDISSQPPSSVEFSSQLTSDFQSDSSLDTTVQSIPYTKSAEVDNCTESISKDLSSLQLDNPPHMNGNGPFSENTSSSTQNVDLLGSFNEINSIHHNGVSKDRINSDIVVNLKSDSDETFDEIIDLSQTNLSNEDSVNSNNQFVPQPIIAFEDNLNLKQNNQNQDSPSNVPDLLL